LLFNVMWVVHVFFIDGLLFNVKWGVHVFFY
jgi:hypothetical protein